VSKEELSYLKKAFENIGTTQTDKPTTTVDKEQFVKSCGEKIVINSIDIVGILGRNMNQFVYTYLYNMFASFHVSKIQITEFPGKFKVDNNTLDFEKFLCVMSVLLRGTTEEQLSCSYNQSPLTIIVVAFHTIDVNNSGKITQNDLTKVISSAFSVMEDLDLETASVDAFSIILSKRLDISEEKGITKEEFVRGMIVHRDYMSGYGTLC
jgi:Ca2+-binding EF-hand superfamily protein